MTLGVVAALLLASVPVLFGVGEVPAALDLLDRTAWLASEIPGHVVRVSADSGRPDARVELGAAAPGLDVEQSATGVFVTVGDEVRRIDASSLTWGAAAERDGAGFLAGRDLGFLVDADGHVRVLDGTSLEVLDELAVAGRPGDPVVTGADDLVVPISGGRIQVVSATGSSEPVRLGGSAIPQLAAVDGRIVAVTGDEELVVLRSDGSVERRFPAGVGPDDVLLAPEVSGDHAWMTVSGAGELQGVRVDDGTTVRVPVGGSDELGRPVVVGGLAYVVDHAGSEVVVVDLADGSVRDRAHLDVADPTRVQLTVRGDVVFVNDPASALALVGDEGELSTLDKYVDDGVAVVEPDQPDEPDVPEAPTAPEVTPPATDPAAAPVVAPPAPGASPDPAPATSGPPPVTPPGPVTVLAAVPGDRSATISWSPPSEGGSPESIELTWPGAPAPVTVGGGARSALVSGLRNGEAVVITVRGVNRAGAGPAVDAPAVTPTSNVPAAVEGVTATGGNQQATVTWRDLPDLDVDAYVVQPAATGTNPPSAAAVEVAAGRGTTTVTGLAAGHEWTFTVTARNDRGASGPPSQPSRAVLVVGPPGPIGAVDLSTGDGTVGLAWGPADDRRSGAVSYEVLAQPTPGSGPNPQTGAATSASFGGLQNGVTYTFTITPFNGHGRGTPTQVQARPARAPSVSGLQATFSGDARANSRFDVRFDVDDGGLPTTCRITVVRLDPGGPVQESQVDGCGAIGIDTHQLARTYELRVVATNERGDSAAATVQAAAPAKRITLTSDRLDPADGFEPGGTVAQWTDPHPPDDVSGYVPNRTDVDAECWIDDGAWSSDVNGDYRVWVRLTSGLWEAASIIDSGPQVISELGRC